MSKTKNVVIDQQNNQNENKQQAIQYLTDLMATVTNYYLKGRIKPSPLRISESRWVPGQVGIDLYNFGNRPVCDGLNFLPIHFDDGSIEQGFVFAMHYNADEVTPLTFLVDFTNLPEIQVEPEALPTDTLKNITKWLEQAMQPVSSVAGAVSTETNEPDTEKQESDFAQAVLDLQVLDLETLDQLHTACHEAIAQLQGDMRLPEATSRYAILSHILTVEMVAFKAYARKYTEQQNQNK